MNNWLDALLAIARTPAVLVTVAAVAGSSPRETGAKMAVTADAQFDSIGGGHLELRACEIARAMLADGRQRRLEQFALGPSLGQCCGGTVQLAFERIGADSRLTSLQRRWRQRQDSWRLVALDQALPPLLLDHDGRCLEGAAAGLPALDAAQTTHLLRDAGGRLWLADACRAWRAHLLLFGAGHVGMALVRALADLPCHVTWIDEREGMFPPSLPANTRIEITDVPEAEVAAAAAGASYLVMTHSHALDQRLCEAILRRGDAGWFGLIGSKTKRMQFERRLLARGIVRDQLDRMICPVGVPGISGKQPAVIAVAVCAQLLQVWEAQEHAAAVFARV
jgi:xanthine dehydrogenase accessory factor